LILLAVNDRQYRVEVGYGLEGILPNGKVGGFGREMVPALRRQDYDGNIARHEKIERVIAHILSENRAMLRLAKHFHFALTRDEDPTALLAVLDLK
jgi:uncharacterized membrane protein YgcG